MSQEKRDLFSICSEIVAKLEALPDDDKARVLRWVGEHLAIDVPSGVVLPPQSQQRSAETRPSIASHRPKDIRTFVEEKNPTSDVQFATVVAYYYRFEAPENERRETVTAEVLQESTRQAGWKRFTKPIVPLNNAVTLGYLDRLGEGQFSINAVGENLVAMTLPERDKKMLQERKRHRTGKNATQSKRPGKKARAKAE